MRFKFNRKTHQVSIHKIDYRDLRDILTFATNRFHDSWKEEENGRVVYSYGLPICMRMKDGSYQLRESNSTRTTNSQISACMVYLRGMKVEIVPKIDLYRDPLKD